MPQNGPLPLPAEAVLHFADIKRCKFSVQESARTRVRKGAGHHRRPRRKHHFIRDGTRKAFEKIANTFSHFLRIQRFHKLDNDKAPIYVAIQTFLRIPRGRFVLREFVLKFGFSNMKNLDYEVSVNLSL